MKKFKNFITENLAKIIKQKDSEYEKYIDKDPSLYQQTGLNNKSRLYTSKEHAFFTVGSTVNVPSRYENITRGVVVHGGRLKNDAPGQHSYVVRMTLPEKHPDAVDENGEHTLGSNIKHGFFSAKELTKHNPESEWDGK